MKRLIVDNTWVEDYSGLARYGKEILARTPADWQLLRIGVAARIRNPLYTVALTAAVARAGTADLFWSPGFIPPLASRMPVIVTVHDLMHLKYYSAAHRAYYNWVLRPLYRRTPQLICSSAYTRDWLADWGGIGLDRIAVIPCAVASDFRPDGERHAANEPYLLYAGNYRSYKNLPRLITAYGRSRLPREGVALKLTGRGDETLRAQITAEGLEGRVQFTGFVPEEQLPALYRSALGLAYVSLHEGFGLPILEAMASAVPVLTSTVSSMPEVAGDAALLVNPEDLAAITEGLEKLAFDSTLRSTLVDRGLVRARQYSWQNTAAAFWQLAGRQCC